MRQIDIAKIEKAAFAGGEILKKYFGQNLKQTVKGTLADLKTRADDESEEMIYLSLKADFPQAGFILEENGEIEADDKEMKFVVDPLDGTNNFVLGIPNFTISIALYEKEKIVAGVIYNPILDRMYVASLGEGATVNGEKIRVNVIDEVKKSTVAYICNYVNSAEYQNNIFRELGRKKSREF